MARRTRLSLVAQTPADDPAADNRRVNEAFPPPPPPVHPDSQLAADVMDLLRRDTERALAIAGQANSAAAAALDRANLAASDTGTLAAATETLARRTSAVEQVGERAVAALTDQARGQQARAVSVALAAAAQQSVMLVIQCLAYLVDRAPVLIALASAVWLWSRVLDDPSALRLVGLGLFGLLVIGPALWLSTRRGGANAG